VGASKRKHKVMKNVRNEVSSEIRIIVKSPVWSTIGNQVRDLVEDKIGSRIRGQIFDSLYIDVQENIDASWPIRKV
jgi:hypothetical protein